MFHVLLFLFASLFSVPLYSHVNPAKTYVELQCANVGMFSSVMSVIGMLDYYMIGDIEGGEVVFGTNGLYYDKKYGPNWWEYYFEPIKVGKNKKCQVIQTVNGPVGQDYAMHTEFQITRMQVANIIAKYIHIKPRILKKVDRFVARHFVGEPMIGVHYRGTDKISEAPRASYEMMIEQINQWLVEHPSDNFSIFVATDEQLFLDYLQLIYPGKVIAYDAFRSLDQQPVHFIHPDNYQKGEDALVDCILLARCDVLIKTSSNLSLCSAYFNPNIPMIHVTKRPWQEPLE